MVVNSPSPLKSSTFMSSASPYARKGTLANTSGTNSAMKETKGGTAKKNNFDNT